MNIANNKASISYISCIPTYILNQSIYLSIYLSISIYSAMYCSVYCYSQIPNNVVSSEKIIPIAESLPRPLSYISVVRGNDIPSLSLSIYLSIYLFLSISLYLYLSTSTMSAFSLHSSSHANRYDRALHICSTNIMRVLFLMTDTS